MRMGQILSIVRLILWLAVLYVIAFLLDKVGIINLPSQIKFEYTRAQQVDMKKVACLATAMLADTRGEAKIFESKSPPDLKSKQVKELVAGRLKLMRRIGEANIRFSILYKADLCDVTSLALTQIPVGDSRDFYYLGRYDWYVKREMGDYWWNQAMLSSEELLTRSAMEILSSSCEDQYVRAPRGTWNESTSSISRLDDSTISAPKVEGEFGKARFRCPKAK